MVGQSFKRIKKVLIANRSEIALRIQATCKMFGIQTVAIYAPEDSQASYVLAADESHQLSQSGITGYFDQDSIIALAQKSHASAIHPGYGFLSENAHFAQKVIDAGLIWIGPSPEIIRLMGDKVKARLRMEREGVPVVPGFYMAQVDTASLEAAKIQAHTIGYPLLLKDPLSGGGKAMRRVQEHDLFDRAWHGVLGESKSLTGSQQMLIEKYLQNTRHVEIQVAGDGKQVIHLYERECSVQRRHQKIVEEAPCAFVSTKTLEAMYAVACRVAGTVGYNSIGTVEFLVTQEEQFYFLEMNTRLQVEHALTELTVGIDLVALQLRIAEFGSLGYAQADISRRGHALECRIYSEDPAHNFLPSVGTIRDLRLPSGPFIRHDHDLRAGMVVTPYFDPMLSKLISFGATRADACRQMLVALQQFVLTGVTTNISFLQALLATDDFSDGKFTTQLLADQQYLKKLVEPACIDEVDLLAEKEVAAVAAFLIEQLSQREVQHKKIEKRPSGCVSNNWKSQAW